MDPKTVAEAAELLKAANDRNTDPRVLIALGAVRSARGELSQIVADGAAHPTEAITAFAQRLDEIETSLGLVQEVLESAPTPGYEVQVGGPMTEGDVRELTMRATGPQGEAGQAEMPSTQADPDAREPQEPS